MAKKRVVAFIDGFNLYHAINDLQRNELKWVDLRRLVGCFTDPNVHNVERVYYFSAIAEWLNGPAKRHREYVNALKSVGVTPIMGTFKEKDRSCRDCGSVWKAHEEKESDVNIAVAMVHESFEDTYDQAFLITGDSDLTPPIKLIRARFPEKAVKVICPPGRYHSKELWGLATHRAKIQTAHLERSLFPSHIPAGEHWPEIHRPGEYDPPAP